MLLKIQHIVLGPFLLILTNFWNLALCPLELMIVHQKSSAPLISILPLFHLPFLTLGPCIRTLRSPAPLLSSMPFHTQESLPGDVVCGLLTLLLHLQILFFSSSFKPSKLLCIAQNLLCAGMLSCFSHVQLFVIPWTTACQAPPSMGCHRQEYWSGLPFPPLGDLPDPGIERRSAWQQILYWLNHQSPPVKSLQCMVISESLQHCSNLASQFDLIIILLDKL